MSSGTAIVPAFDVRYTVGTRAHSVVPAVDTTEAATRRRYWVGRKRASSVLATRQARDFASRFEPITYAVDDAQVPPYWILLTPVEGSEFEVRFHGGPNDVAVVTDALGGEAKLSWTSGCRDDGRPVPSFFHDAPVALVSGAAEIVVNEERRLCVSYGDAGEPVARHGTTTVSGTTMGEANVRRLANGSHEEGVAVRSVDKRLSKAAASEAHTMGVPARDVESPDPAHPFPGLRRERRPGGRQVLAGLQMINAASETEAGRVGRAQRAFLNANTNSTALDGARAEDE